MGIMSDLAPGSVVDGQTFVYAFALAVTDVDDTFTTRVLPRRKNDLHGGSPPGYRQVGARTHRW